MERRNISMMFRVRAVLLNNKVNVFFWDEAVKTVVYLITIFVNLRLSLVSNLYMDHNNMV